MSLVVDRLGPGAGRSLAVAALILFNALPAAAQTRNAASAGTVVISVDQAQVMKLPDNVGTLVVGNPLIADVSIQSGGMVVLIGKGYGVTNLVALDRDGAMLEQKTIQVQAPRDAVVVYRGTARESYSCTPNCERRITLGDSPEFFAATMAQTMQRTPGAQQGAMNGPVAK
jgi:Flp pilus assembly secretin CpaC